MIFGQERYENYKLQNGFEEKKIQITDDNELQAALHLMYKQCPEDDRDTYNPGTVLSYQANLTLTLTYARNIARISLYRLDSWISMLKNYESL